MEEALRQEEMDWTAYARSYDYMCMINPHYQDNIDRVLSVLKAKALPDKIRIGDLGAGTGNYVLPIAKAFPKADVVHVDANPEMNRFAQEKYVAAGLEVELIESRADKLELPSASFDVLISIHALYAMSPQEELLRKVKTWLKPGGLFIVIDLGRKMNTTDWGINLIWRAIRAGRFFEYIRHLSTKGKEVIRQNKLTAEGQESGTYWTHTTEEFGNVLESAGFVVEELDTCYRGYSDFAVCRPD